MKVPNTLQKYAPKWYNYLTEKVRITDGRIDSLSDNELSIGLPDRCIVGEVWNFTREYFEPEVKCDVCDEASVDFVTFNEERMEQRLANYTNHLERDHPELIKE